MFGCPVILNVAPGTGIETRNAVPVEVWQSVQWQICVRSGSASPSILMAPQAHPPSIFMTLFLSSSMIPKSGYRFSDRIMLKLSSFGRLFDRRHIRVRQAEVMADLVHQNMLDDGPQCLVVLGPIIEDRPPVQTDNVRHLDRLVFCTERDDR